MIYFIQEMGFLRSRVKIGFSENPMKRLTGLRTGSPSRLKMLIVIEGDEDAERYYHRKFSQYHLHGEWFRYGFWLKLFIWENWGKPYPYLGLNQRSEKIPDEAKTEVAFISPTALCSLPDQATLSEQAAIECWLTKPGNKSAAFRAWHLAEKGYEFESRPNGDDLKFVMDILVRHGIIHPVTLTLSDE